MSSPTIKTRILIISDTHNAPLSSKEHGEPTAPFKSPLPSADLLIHCGDLTMTGELHEYHKTLDMLAEIDAPVKLVIPGNHDLSLDSRFVHSHATHDPQHRQPPNLTRDKAQARHQTALDLWTSPTGRASLEGITYLSEGTHSITLPNGALAKIYASPYTPEFCDWAFAYGPREDRFNDQDQTLEWVTSFAEKPIPTRKMSESAGAGDVDIVITHGPPYKRLDPTAWVPAVGCPLLLRAIMRARPKVCCFGHIHEGWGAERVRWADGAGEAAVKECSLEEWRDGVWEEGVGKVERVEVDLEEAKEKRAVFVDVSEEGGKGLREGEETLFVNAAVMDVVYRPVNAPWVVDLDLPRADGGGI